MGTRGDTFSHRVVTIWKELPEEPVEAGIIIILKINLDKCMDRKSYEDHGSNAGRWD